MLTYMGLFLGALIISNAVREAGTSIADSIRELKESKS